ncbi:hypothetical protein I317_02593 [Kwoniella heveanensis CBS 569]|nr:hypothetical protein I317_02593 [Kwoniella heveanensis CBS 569]
MTRKLADDRAADPELATGMSAIPQAPEAAETSRYYSTQMQMRPTKGCSRVVTLEQFIVDTFSRINEGGVERPVLQPDQIGGGGTYAIIGARMFLPPRKLGMIIDYTPESLSKSTRDELCGYGEDMWAFRIREDAHPTARALNTYNPRTQHRGFKYLSPPLLLTPRSLQSTPFNNPALPSTIHFISYPAPRAELILSEVRRLRYERGWDPIIVWEPEEESLNVMQRIAAEIDIIGPNHHEITRLFGLTIPPVAGESRLREIYTQACRKLAALQPRIGAIIRCGHLGCCYAQKRSPSQPPPPGVASEGWKEHENEGDIDVDFDVRWSPAFWHPGREGYEAKIVDPTGAGNAFMGGLAAGLDQGKSLDEAVIWGNVAASFTIEQDGLPHLSIGENGRELWNGQDPWLRVEEMKAGRGSCVIERTIS